MAGTLAHEVGMIYRLSDIMKRVTGDADSQREALVVLTRDIPDIGRGNIVRTQVNAIRSDSQSEDAECKGATVYAHSSLLCRWANASESCDEGER